MSAPCLGYREDPIGADAGDCSSDDWDDEEFDDTYDTPENMINLVSQSNREPDEGDEVEEDLYDVPEFAPEEIDPVPNTGGQGPPPIPRDRKPGKVPSFKKFNEQPHIEENYELPQDKIQDFGRQGGNNYRKEMPPPIAAQEEEYLAAVTVAPSRPQKPIKKIPENPAFKSPHEVHNKNGYSRDNGVPSSSDLRGGDHPANLEENYEVPQDKMPRIPKRFPSNKANESSSMQVEAESEYLTSVPVVPGKPVPVRNRPSGSEIPKKPVPKPVPPKPSVPSRGDKPCVSPRTNRPMAPAPKPTKKPVTKPSSTPSDMNEVSTYQHDKTGRAPLSAPTDMYEVSVPSTPVIGMNHGNQYEGNNTSPRSLPNIPPVTHVRPPVNGRSDRERDALQGEATGPAVLKRAPKNLRKDVQENYEVMEESNTRLNTGTAPFPSQQYTYEAMSTSSNNQSANEQMRSSMNHVASPVSQIEQDNYEVPAEGSGSCATPNENLYEVDQQSMQPKGQHNGFVQDDYEVLPESKGNQVAEEPGNYEVPDGNPPAIRRTPKPWEAPSRPNIARGNGFRHASEASADSDDDYIEPNGRVPERAPPPVVKRDAKPVAIKKEGSGGSGKSKDSSGIGQKLMKRTDNTLLGGFHQELSGMIAARASKDVPDETLSGSQGRKGPRLPDQPAVQDTDAILSVDDLEEVFGDRAPNSPRKGAQPSKGGLSPPKPRRSASLEDSMEEIMKASEWYHASSDRANAERKLKQLKKEGMFIVRNTEKGHGYSLSFFAGGVVRHLRIHLNLTTNKYNLGSYDQKFNSVVELIKHFQNNPFEVKAREGSHGRTGELARLKLACPR